MVGTGLSSAGEVATSSGPWRQNPMPTLFQQALWGWEGWLPHGYVEGRCACGEKYTHVKR